VTQERTLTEHTIAPVDSATTLPVEYAALAIVWSSAEPERVGEVALLDRRRTALIGRGDASDNDPHPRLAFVRQRPGKNESQPPLQSPNLSRVQLIVRPVGQGVEVRNEGKCSLWFKGEAVDEATLSPGDVVRLGKQMQLLCVRRPGVLDEVDGPIGDFGAPDAAGLVGESAAMWALRKRIAFVSAHPGHVLVRGPSGTGKELVSRAIHERSGVRGSFVARNAATLPEGLIDAEIFGNVRNYPNPGMAEREGLIGAANGGTLFLDEFAELPGPLQVHLLRVLDDGEYHRLGESKARTANFRLIGATNRPLERIQEDVRARFRFKIDTPPLDARREDIPLLANHIIATGMGGEKLRLSAALCRTLVQHPWRTHVRELDSKLWDARAQSRGEWLDHAESQRATTQIADRTLTRARVVAALENNGGNQEQTWRALGLTSRYALRRLMKRLGIEVERRSKRSEP